MTCRLLRNRCLLTAVLVAFAPSLAFAQTNQPDAESMRQLFSPQALKDIFGDQAANFSFSELIDSSETGERHYDIYVNNRYLIHQKVNIIRGKNGALEVQIPAQVIFIQNLRFEDLPGLADKMPMDMIGNLPDLILGSEVKFDAIAGTVHVSIPQNWYKNFDLRSEIAPVQRWTYGVPAAVVNYRANVDYRRNGSDRIKHGYVDLDGQFNFGRWRLLATGALTYDDNGSERSHEFERGNIYATRVFGQSRTRVRLGEIYTQSFYMESIPLQGIELYDDESMLSNIERSYTPVITGIAQTLARVTVRQFGRIVFERNVPAGPFTFDNLPGLTSGVNLEVTITEQNGQERTYIVPYTSTPLLLRAGRVHFNAAMGRYHDDNDRHSESPFIFTGGIGYGLPLDMSLFAGAQISDDYQGYTAGTAVSLGTGGAVSLQFDHSSYSLNLNNFNETKGLRANLQWNKSIDSTDGFISATWRRYLSGRYLSMSDVVSWRGRNNEDDFGYNYDADLRDDATLSFNQPLGRYGSLSLTGSLFRYKDSRSSQNFSASYTTNWRGVTATLSVQHRLNENAESPTEKETICYLNVSIPLSLFGGYSFSRHSINLSLTRSDDGSLRTTEGISGNFGENNRWSYALSATQDDGARTYYASLSKEAEYGRYTLSASRSDDNDTYTGSLEGSLIATGDGLFLARSLSGSSVLIDIPHAPEARPDQFAVSSRFNGKLLVTGLDDYRINDIAIEPNSIPANVVMPIYIKRMVPADNAILRVTYETQRGLQFVPEIYREDGSKLPFGTMVRIIGNKLLSGMDTVVNERSRAYFPSAPLVGFVEAVWDEDGEQRTCWAPYNLLDIADTTPDDKIVRRTLTCHPVDKSREAREQK